MERGGIQFLHEARLLSLREMLAAAQERQGPAALGKAFAALAAAHRAPRGGAGSASSSGEGCSRLGGTAHGWAGGMAAAAAAVPETPAEPDVLLPFSAELRGRRRYCMDLQGRVWLASGWHAHACAPSLAALLRRILT